MVVPMRRRQGIGGRGIPRLARWLHHQRTALPPRIDFEMRAVLIGLRRQLDNLPTQPALTRAVRIAKQRHRPDAIGQVDGNVHQQAIGLRMKHQVVRAQFARSHDHVEPQPVGRGHRQNHCAGNTGNEQGGRTPDYLTQ